MKTFDGILELWVRRWVLGNELDQSMLLPGAVEALRDQLIKNGWIPPASPISPPPSGGGDHPPHVHPNQMTVDDYVDPNVMRPH